MAAANSLAGRASRITTRSCAPLEQLLHFHGLGIRSVAEVIPHEAVQLGEPLLRNGGKDRDSSNTAVGEP